LIKFNLTSYYNVANAWHTMYKSHNFNHPAVQHRLLQQPAAAHRGDRRPHPLRGQRGAVLRAEEVRQAVQVARLPGTQMSGHHFAEENGLQFVRGENFLPSIAITCLYLESMLCSQFSEKHYVPPPPLVKRLLIEMV
jgi:hypothetical protein